MPDQTTRKQRSSTVRAAIIGLIGSALTVCGGLAGASISGAVTVYQVEREARQVALAASAGEQALTIDTQQVAISYEEAMRLDADDHYVAPGHGFVLAQPRDGWQEMEEVTYRDLFVERGTWGGSAWDDLPVFRIRHGEPATARFHEGSRVNGAEIDVEALRAAYTDTLRYSNEVTVLVVSKDVAPRFTLAEVALEWGSTQRGGVNRIVADEESDYVLMQSSWHAENVQVDGQDTDLALERWALFGEGPQNYYVVEIVYLPRTGQPVQVWQDLQAYVDSFRVIR
jgi:hypothetical protein